MEQAGLTTAQAHDYIELLLSLPSALLPAQLLSTPTQSPQPLVSMLSPTSAHQKESPCTDEYVFKYVDVCSTCTCRPLPPSPQFPTHHCTHLKHLGHLAGQLCCCDSSLYYLEGKPRLTLNEVHTWDYNDGVCNWSRTTTQTHKHHST